MSGAPPGKEAAVELTSGQARYLLAVYHLGLGARGVRCADIALTREEAQLAACALLDVLPERCFTQGEVPSA